MQHQHARRAVDLAMAGSGFGRRVVAAVAVVALQEREDCPAELRSRLLERLDGLGRDEAPPYRGTAHQFTIPSQRERLCGVLAPIAARHPGDPALNLSALTALAGLWPHCSGEEQPLLRLRFLAGLCGRGAKPGASVEPDTLAAWAAQQPTEAGCCHQSTGRLCAFLAAPDPEAAYHCLAELLDGSLDLAAVARALGSLAAHQMGRLRDDQGDLGQLFVGAAATETLCAWTSPAILATLIAQLGHRLWWLRNRSGLKPFEPQTTGLPADPLEAVLAGEVATAQAAARALTAQAGCFWPLAWDLLDRCLPDDPEAFAHLVTVAAAAARRGGTTVSPDDAAALLGALAASGQHTHV